MIDLSQKLAEIQALAEKATPGPWSIESCGEKGDGSNMIGVAFREDDHDCKNQLSGWLETFDDAGEEIPYYRDELIAECEHRNRNSHANAAYIAAVNPAAMLALIAQVRALVKERDEYQERWLDAIGMEARNG